MIIIGLFVAFGVDFFYGIVPVIVGIALVVYYRRYLMELLGVY